MAQSLKVLEQMVIFTLGGSRIVQGNKTVSLDTLNLSGVKPPKAVYNEGGLKTVSKDLVNPFDSIKKRADRYLQSVAVQFLNGYGTAEIKADEVGAKLDAFQQEFEAEKVRLAPLYEQLQAQHFNQFPGWEATIMALAPTSLVFFDGMRLHWDAFKVGATANAALQKGIHSAAGSLYSTLCNEVSAAAHKVFESLAGREKLKAGNTVIERLATIATKLEGISFVDSRVMPICELVRDAIAGIPAGEALQTDRIMYLIGLCTILKDEANLVAYGENLLSGQVSATGIIAGFKKPAPSAVKAAATPIQVSIPDVVAVAEVTQVKVDLPPALVVAQTAPASGKRFSVMF